MVAGIVVDMIDEIVHGATLGKRGIAPARLRSGADTGFVERLFCLLAEHGYRIYLTADHGNVEAEGIGRLSQGVVSELRGERVRTYRSDALAASVPEDIDAFRFDLAGLPSGLLAAIRRRPDERSFRRETRLSRTAEYPSKS